MVIFYSYVKLQEGINPRHDMKLGFLYGDFWVDCFMNGPYDWTSQKKMEALMGKWAATLR